MFGHVKKSSEIASELANFTLTLLTKNKEMHLDLINKILKREHMDRKLKKKPSDARFLY